jgi:uncharacterized protein YndB with AHSA1/START domain
MANKLSVTVSTEINASPEKVWRAITEPALIKQYMYGTDTTSDWKKGSSITYKGVYNGKAYEDKGEIIDIIPQKLLHTTHFSPMTGKEDKPENYAHVIQELTPQGGITKITLTQDNIATEKEAKQMRQNWTGILDGMKKTVEAL